MNKANKSKEFFWITVAGIVAIILLAVIFVSDISNYLQGVFEIPGA